MGEMRKRCREEGWSDFRWTALGLFGATGSRITEETVQAATMLRRVTPSVLDTKAKR
jgi:hypothetical protein